jgi:adenosylcobinamide kinase/adenosylcobinamide-phosphate guanylyltransferase
LRFFGNIAHVVLILITGPVRSGKSRFAETRASRARGPVTYLATAPPYPEDIEWGERLARHLERRPRTWRTIETAGMDSLAIEKIIRQAPARTTLLIDSLGTWLADRMEQTTGEHPTAVMTKLDLLAECFADACIASKARLIVVGEEVGWGLVPEHPSGRIFRDVLGRLQQRLAGAARNTYLVVAGYAVDVKAHGEPINPRQRRPANS